MKKKTLKLIEKVSANGVTEETKTKFLYHLSYAKEKFIDGEIDKDYLKQIKRVRWREVEEKYLTKCHQEMQQIKTYVENNPFNVEEALKDLKSKWLNVF